MPILSRSSLLSAVQASAFFPLSSEDSIAMAISREGEKKYAREIAEEKISLTP